MVILVIKYSDFGMAVFLDKAAWFKQIHIIYAEIKLYETINFTRLNYTKIYTLEIKLDSFNVIKIFSKFKNVHYELGCFVPGKPFQTSQMFASKAGEASFMYSTLGALQALPTNIRLGWKGLPGSNFLANYRSKKSCNIGPIKIFLQHLKATLEKISY